MNRLSGTGSWWQVRATGISRYPDALGVSLIAGTEPSRPIVAEVDPSTGSVEDAIILAAHAHRGQRYPSPEAEPYILHPIRMMIEFGDPIDQMAAVLHDVVEDTDCQVGDLAERGFPDAVVTAIEFLTHRPNEDYADYIERLSANDVARRVKIIDLRHNLANNPRLPESKQIAERVARYEEALVRLGAM
jgi:(p)ppGpp synthase/HD superfamily hydrolase